MSVRRGLPVLSLGLIPLGLEISGGAFTEASARILRDLGSVAAGEPTSVYLPAFFAGLLAIAAGAAGLGASLWSRAIRGRLTSGKRCPECGGAGRPDRAPLLAAAFRPRSGRERPAALVPRLWVEGIVPDPRLSGGGSDIETHDIETHEREACRPGAGRLVNRF